MDPKPPPPSILNHLIKADTAVSLHLHNAAQPLFPRSLLKTLEISGDGRLFFPVTISLLLSPLATTSPFLRLFLADLLVGAAVDLLLVGLIKHLVRRPRPVYNRGMFLTLAVDHWSFPSGHSSRVCFVAAFSCLSVESIRLAIEELKFAGNRFGGDWIDGKRVGYVVLIVCLWSVLTSISRVFLGRHFVCDVIAGAFLGIVEALLGLYLFQKHIRHRFGWHMFFVEVVSRFVVFQSIIDRIFGKFITFFGRPYQFGLSDIREAIRMQGTCDF